MQLFDRSQTYFHTLLQLEQSYYIMNQTEDKKSNSVLSNSHTFSALGLLARLDEVISSLNTIPRSVIIHDFF